LSAARSQRASTRSLSMPSQMSPRESSKTRVTESLLRPFLDV
jgi:hypothetical protein